MRCAPVRRARARRRVMCLGASGSAASSVYSLRPPLRARADGNRGPTRACVRAGPLLELLRSNAQLYTALTDSPDSTAPDSPDSSAPLTQPQRQTQSAIAQPATAPSGTAASALLPAGAQGGTAGGGAVASAPIAAPLGVEPGADPAEDETDTSACYEGHLPSLEGKPEVSRACRVTAHARHRVTAHARTRRIARARRGRTCVRARCEGACARRAQRPPAALMAAACVRPAARYSSPVTASLSCAHSASV